MARRLWPNGDAIGAEISIDDNNTGPRPVEISGIVGNVKQLSLESDQTFDIYFPRHRCMKTGSEDVTDSHYWVVRSTAEKVGWSKRDVSGETTDRSIATQGLQI